MMSSVILAYAIALAPRSRPFICKRKNNLVVVEGRLRHLRRWFFLPVEPSTCIYIKWRVVGIFKSNSLSNKHELVQKGGRWRGGEPAVRKRWVSIYHQRDNELVPRSSAPRGTCNPRRSFLLSFFLQSISLLLISAWSLFLFHFATFQAVTQCGKWENDKKIYSWRLRGLRQDSEM